ncbi:MAG: insulinase family protein, partial [Myxococcota bacterium]
MFFFANPAVASPREVTLGNGLRVLLLPLDGPPVVGVAVAYKAGRVDEPPGRYGLAHFVEHLTFRTGPIE